MGLRVEFVGITMIVIFACAAALFLYNTIPSQGTQLDRVLNKACERLKTVYKCDSTSLDKILESYSELGQQPRYYTLTELCSLKSMYYVGPSCAVFCGCNLTQPLQNP